MAFYKKEKKDRREIELYFTVKVPEKLTYDKEPVRSAGHLSLKIGQTYYLVELDYGQNNPAFIKVGEHTNEKEALISFCYAQRSETNEKGLPNLTLSSYDSLLLQHIVAVEGGPDMIMVKNTPTKKRNSIIAGKQFSKNIDLPKVIQDLSTDKGSVSEIMVTIEVKENLDYETTFENLSSHDCAPTG